MQTAGSQVTSDSHRTPWGTQPHAQRLPPSFLPRWTPPPLTPTFLEGRTHRCRHAQGFSELPAGPPQGGEAEQQEGRGRGTWWHLVALGGTPRVQISVRQMWPIFLPLWTRFTPLEVEASQGRVSDDPLGGDRVSLGSYGHRPVGSWQPGALELFGILWNSADAVTPGLVLS